MKHTSNRGQTPKSSLAFVLALAIAAPVAFAGCASAKPSQQLLTARTTYEQARTGPAARYAPDELLEASNLLEQAEDAEAGSEEEQHLAYLADRQTRLATAVGTTEMYEARKRQADQQYVVLQEQGRVAAERGLTEAERELEMKERQLSAQEQELQDARRRAAAAMESLEELGNVKAEQDRTILTLSGAVLFKTGQDDLLPIAQDHLKRVADGLQQLDETQKLTVVGHTDSRGAAEMNQSLSQRRADSVMNYLVEQGVDQEKITAIGRGESDPIASNDSPEGRANNRRVEIVIEDPTIEENRGMERTPGYQQPGGSPQGGMQDPGSPSGSQR